MTPAQTQRISLKREGHHLTACAATAATRLMTSTVHPIQRQLEYGFAGSTVLGVNH